MHPNNSLTADRVREVLNYDPATGVFTWRVNKGRIKAGSKAGYRMTSGYWSIGVDDRKHLAHRLAWLWTHGRWPKAEIDHANGNRADNRIQNLREASKSQNMQNMGPPKDNTSGFKGVCWAKLRSKWMSRIQINSRYIFLGYHDTPEAAHEAYCEAARKHFGEFARTS